MPPAMFRRTAEIAAPLGERRRWRDGIEGGAIVDACRGDWPAALDGIKEMRLSAARDGDQRYLLLAYREQAFLELQTGRFDDAARILPLIKAEIDRGIKAEELIARQDYHAIAGTLALERGDAEQRRRRGGCGAGCFEGSLGQRQPSPPLLDALPGRPHLSQSLAPPVGNGLGTTTDTARKADHRVSTAEAALERASDCRTIGLPGARRFGVAARAARSRAGGIGSVRYPVASALDMRYEAALAREGLLPCRSAQRRFTPWRSRDCRCWSSPGLVRAAPTAPVMSDRAARQHRHPRRRAPRRRSSARPADGRPRSIRRHLRRVPSLTNPALSLLPQAFPIFELPYWMTPASARRKDAAFQEDMAYSTFSGYYAIRLIDNITDRRRAEGAPGPSANGRIFSLALSPAVSQAFSGRPPILAGVPSRLE